MDAANNHQHTAEGAVAVVKLTPPVSASVLVVSGHTLQEWLVLLTIIYTLLMLLHQLWKMHRDWSEARRLDAARNRHKRR